MKNIFFIILFVSVLKSQYLPVYSKYYDYLNYFELQNGTVLNNFNRIKDVHQLDRIFNNPKDFYPSVNSKEIINEFNNYYIRKNITDSLNFINDSGRYRLFSFYNNDFQLSLNPKIRFDYLQFPDQQIQRTFGGIELIAQYHDFDFYLSFVDNQIRGNEINNLIFPNNQTGYVKLKNTKYGYEYGEVDAYARYKWQNGSLTFGKNPIIYGYENEGQLVISDKIPSVPFLNIDLDLTPWLKFTYSHFWLHSGLIDSNSIRETNVTNRESYDRRKKFMALHFLTILPLENLEITLGESVVYADELEPIYLIPVMFFRLADHYLMDGEGGSDSGDNAQLFAGFKYINQVLNASLYGTLFIDEFSFSSLSGDKNVPSSIAYSVGSSFINPFWKNNYFNIEYSRLNPFVYMNGNNAQDFTSHHYDLGHWIGSNSDLLSLTNTQFILYNLTSKIKLQYLRKGREELPIEQYQLPYPDFLYGGIYTRSNLSASLLYEIFPNLTLFGEYSYYNQNKIVTKLQKKSFSAFNLSLNLSLL